MVGGPICRIGSLTWLATHREPQRGSEQPPMVVAPSGLTFSIQDIPFSYHGSWINISPVVAEKTFADDLHLISHQTGLHPVLRFTPSADAMVVATPALLTWRHDAGRVEAVYAG